MTKRIIHLAAAALLLASAPSAHRASAQPASDHRAAAQPSAASSGWTASEAERPIPSTFADGGGAVRETVWSLERPPAGPYDRIRLHRYRGEARPFAALLYLPGTHMNGAYSGLDEAHDLVLYLARRGVEVYALDYRTHAVPPDAAAADLGWMADWTTEVFAADVAAAAARARESAAGLPLFVAGFSRGAFFAYAQALADGEVAGVVALDGYFKTRPAPCGNGTGGEECRPPAAPTPEQVARLRQSGKAATDLSGSLGWELRQALMNAVAADPAAPPLGNPEQSSGARSSGDQLAAILYRAWGPGGLAHPVEARPDRGVSRVQVLAELLGGYDRYWPAVQDLEGAALTLLADDPSTPLDDGWEELRRPVIYFGSTGMGPDFLIGGLHSAGHVGGREAEIHVLEGHGHLDVLVGESARDKVFSPLLSWLAVHAPRSEEAGEAAPPPG